MVLNRPPSPQLLRPEDADPRWKWNRAIPAPGHMNVDFEGRVEFDRLRHYRLQRARAALEKSECGALLLFDVNHIRYITATKIGEWEREEEVVVTDTGCTIISLFPAEELPIANRY
jgi:Xaa-Pro aminopeptidase